MKKPLKHFITLFFVLIISLFFNVTSYAGWLSSWFSSNNATNQNPSEKVRALLSESDLNPKVLQLALKAYQNAKKRGLASKNILTIIDFSLPATEKRLWVINLENNQIPFHTLVAHGKNSGDNITTAFSNQPGSKASSLGVFLTGSTYFGSKGYALNLYGLEKSFNDRAYERRVVFHGAPYVSDNIAKQLGRLGRSWGCPALDQRIAPQVIDYIKKGSVVFAYYPDKKWLAQSKFLSGATV